MNTLAEFFRFNRWADERVFKVSARADAALLQMEAGGTNGTVLSTLAHMVSVSEAFSALFFSAPVVVAALELLPDLLVTSSGLADGYFEHDLHWYMERADYLDQFLCEVAAKAGNDALSVEVMVPWMGFELTIHQALMQVLVHCGHHRSQVFSALGAQGVKVPDLDYIVMLAKERREQAAGS